MQVTNLCDRCKHRGVCRVAREVLGSRMSVAISECADFESVESTKHVIGNTYLSSQDYFFDVYMELDNDDDEVPYVYIDIPLEIFGKVQYVTACIWVNNPDAVIGMMQEIKRRLEALEEK